MPVSGPFFEGTAQTALPSGMEAVCRKLASEAPKHTPAAFQARIRASTGRFAGSITQTRQSQVYVTRGGRQSYSLPVVVEDVATDIVVTTDLATYGPWLEGSGSRNVTTRFKGYHGFAQAAQDLSATAEGIAEQEIGPYVDRMN